jgi:arylsulfatase
MDIPMLFAMSAVGIPMLFGWTHRPVPMRRCGFAGVIALALAGSGCADRTPQPLVDLSQGPPSLVLIGIDTFRADHLGCYGNREVRTPNLDRFAEQAILFEDCNAASTWTLPSFASVFTGLWPVHHGALGGKHRHLDPAVPTLAEILKKQGYYTNAFVAVDFLTGHFGMARGYDRLGAFVHGPVTGRLEQYQKRMLRVPRYLRQDPWFLFVHYFDAHDPYRPPPPFDRMYYEGDPSAESPGHEIDVIYSDRNRLRADPKRRYKWLNGVRDLRFPVAQYAAGVTYVDHHVGALLDSLDTTGKLDRSIVVVLADHGEHLTEHDIYFTHLLPYAECLHVPLMIRLPGGRAGGTRIHEPVSLVDVLPTLCDLMGIPLPAPVDGVSLVPLLRGGHLPPRILLAERGSNPSHLIKAAWDADYRLIDFFEDGRSRFELYDRRRDPGELHDLASEAPPALDRLRDELDRVFGPERRLIDRLEPGEDEPLDPAVERRLRALGYVD